MRDGKVLCSVSTEIDLECVVTGGRYVLIWRRTEHSCKALFERVTAVEWGRLHHKITALCGVVVLSSGEKDGRFVRTSCSAATPYFGRL